MKKLIVLIFINSCLIYSTHIIASEANVIDAEVKKGNNGSFIFYVTVQHADEGWNHYADHWLILDKDEQLIAACKLMHPHVKEQPFTRSLSHIELPDEVTEVIIRAHCSVDNYSGNSLILNIH